MSKQNSTANSRFAPKEVPSNLSMKTADLMIEVERLRLLDLINHRPTNYDTPEHVFELYTLIGLNLAQSQLRMAL